MDDFISEDDLLTFEGFLKYQGVPATSAPADLKMWRGYFEEAKWLHEASPKIGLMKLQPIPGEQKYAVAIRDGSYLWLTLWVRCSRKGEIFIMYPRGNRDWDAHASYHANGTFHQKSFGATFGSPQKRQPLTSAFRESEHLGMYGGHGKSTGAICDRKAFDGVVIVEPGILGPRDGAVGVDLVEPGYEPKWSGGDGQRFYVSGIDQREVFLRNGSPSVVVTITR
jgi:hypothetical protein